MPGYFAALAAALAPALPGVLAGALALAALSAQAQRVPGLTVRVPVDPALPSSTPNPISS
jgi:hypothetical protein